MIDKNKAFNDLKKLFAVLPSDIKDNEIPSHERKGYMDQSSIIMIIPKTYFLKTILTQDFDVKESSIPDVCFDKAGPSKFSPQLLDLIQPLLKHTSDDGIIITVGEDTPIKLETKEVIIYVAPRVC